MSTISHDYTIANFRGEMMDVQLLRAVGSVAGLAGLAVGMILLLYREIVRKNVFPMLAKRDAYRLLQTIAILAWSIAMFGILCWAWPSPGKHKDNSDSAKAKSAVMQPAVIAGTVVDQNTDVGIGQASITVYGLNVNVTSEDDGNFEITLPAGTTSRVRLLAKKSGYNDLDESVVPPTHDLTLQMRAK